ncbi:MAG TPA: response regulator [Myxococcales bacterium]|jgi:CheY-like chemotaxis protein|nr:response regulator [Myxococcales bacterium]
MTAGGQKKPLATRRGGEDRIRGTARGVEVQMPAKILVVDDDKFQLMFLSDVLQAAGFEPIAVSSAIDALKMDLSQIALVLSDVEMPRMDGRSLVEAIRTIKGSEVPFVFVTGTADPRSLLSDAIQYQAEFISKPVAPEELIALVKRMLAG